MTSTEPDQWLVVTDLDGTLLDHHTYSFEAARKTLDALEYRKIPVVINSSKTTSEIKQLRLSLNNKHPFIVENGSAIMIPNNYFSAPIKNATLQGNFWEIILGRSRDKIIDQLNKLPSSIKNHYRSYHQSTINDIVKMTALSNDEARLSMDRHYTEPLQWLGTPDQREDFLKYIQMQNIHYTEGGRFIHLMGSTHKGSATTWLAKHYQQQYKKNINVIALGDGKNDIDMLKAADIAIVIRSPVNDPPIFDHPHKIISNHIGPTGWAETLEDLILKTSNY